VLIVLLRSKDLIKGFQKHAGSARQNNKPTAEHQNRSNGEMILFFAARVKLGMSFRGLLF
jgi:hypothetical protein